MRIQGSFFHKGKKYRLTLTEGGLTWDLEGSTDLRRKVLLCEILSCWICPRGSLTCARNIHHQDTIETCTHLKKGSSGLAIEVCERSEKGCWVASVYVFHHGAKDILLAWYDSIWALINGLPERPGKLVVVINPIGGRRKGVSIFNKKVEPLLRRAGIKTNTLQTEYKGHGRHLVQEAASQGLLRECDGIVAIGGDGLVSEIVTGLFILAASNAGVDPNDPKVELPPTQVRLGIIPSGSTDATCSATHGSNDVVTAALHIIMGDKRCVDVASIHSKAKLHRVVTSLISYGYFGDLLRSSEHLRCLGPPRYILSGLQQILRNRSYPIKIRFRKNRECLPGNDQVISVGNIHNTASCSSICSVCSQVDNVIPSDSSESSSDWEEVAGRFSIVSVAITSCSCRLTPQGVSPLAHLGDGFCDLILVKGSSRTSLLSYLYHTSVTGNSTSLNHVKMIRTNEVHFYAPPEMMSIFNCDGEEFESSSISIKIHRKKLELFCRGVEDPIILERRKRKPSALLPS